MFSIRPAINARLRRGINDAFTMLVSVLRKINSNATKRAQWCANAPARRRRFTKQCWFRPHLRAVAFTSASMQRLLIPAFVVLSAGAAAAQQGPLPTTPPMVVMVPAAAADAQRTRRRVHRIPVRRARAAAAGVLAAAQSLSGAAAADLHQRADPDRSHAGAAFAAGLPDGPALPAPGSCVRGQGNARHGDHRYAQPLPLSGRARRQGDALRHRRRPSRLHLGRHARDLRQEGMAGLGAAQRDARAPAGPAALHGRRSEQSARRARASISARRSTASTARTSPGPSATTSRPAASACATWMSSTSTTASKSAPRWSCSRVRPASDRVRRARAEIHPN